MGRVASRNRLQDAVAHFVVNANHGVPIRLAKVARFFQNSAHMKTTTLPLRNSMNRSPLRAFLLIPLALACFALSPLARAVCQEGCLANVNTVLGEDALVNASGASNTAIGADALGANTTGSANTAVGAFALLFNTTGMFNTATGAAALEENTTGVGNTANGSGALFSNTSGGANTAIGFDALFNNTIGNNNTALGQIGLNSNTTGNNNTALGQNALGNNTTGINNTALGKKAGFNLTTGDNNIDIGNPSVAGEGNTIRIGKQGTQTATYIAGISGATVADGVGVIIDTNGHVGTIVSSERFKDNVQPIGKASEAILSLEPVAFRYKKELDPKGIPQFGLVAEQVEKVNPDLVARDDQGKPYTVRYEAVNAMLLNEFLKEHRKVEEQNRKIREQEATITRLDKGMKTVVARLEELAAQIQKVSAQLEVSKLAPKTVLNNQ